MWTSSLRILTKSSAIPQQLYKSAPRGLSAIAELLVLQGGQQCWALWAFLAACPCTLFIDIISLFINWANKDACLLACLCLRINYGTPAVLAGNNNIFTARCYAWRGLCCCKMPVRPYVRPSHAGIMSKRLDISSNFFHRRAATLF